MIKCCDVCGKRIANVIKVAVDSDLFSVCSFVCKDVVSEGRNTDVGCGIVDDNGVRDVRMCSECSLFNMPVNCYITKRDQGRELMFVAFGRMRGV
jgi:hypothetical protein